MPHSSFSTSDVTTCICASLRRVTRKVTRAYDDALRPIGLTAAQFNILATLNLCPDLPVTELANALSVDRTTLTRNLVPLSKKGLITSGTQDDDRVRTTRLTEAGKARYQDAYPLWHVAQSRLSEALGQENVSKLLNELDAVFAISPDPNS